MQAEISLTREDAEESAPIHLRDYQLDTLAAIRERADAGIRRQLVALPTGTGKTIVFASLPSALDLPGRTLVLAHREELLDQAESHLRAANPARSIAVEQAQRRANGADLVVASVQTLQRHRLAALDPAAFSLVIVDEAHHAVAPSYRTILSHMRAGEPTGPLLVGFTATPSRGDRVGLAEVFDAIVYQRSLREMIAEGWLCRLRAFRVRSTIDLTGVRTRHGDFAEAELAEAVDVADRNALVVQSYRALADGRRALVFAVDVAHAEHLADAFRAAGYAADHVSGRLCVEERRERISAFRTGELEVLTNCMILTEGFDCPEIAAILMARPTQSPLLYAQMVGRGTRTAAGKADLLVLDIADNSRRHSLVSAPSLFGLPATFDCQGGDAIEVAELIESATPSIAGRLGRAVSLEQVRRLLEEADLFAIPEIPEIVRRVSELCWAQIGETFHLTLGQRESLVIEQNLLDRYALMFRGQSLTHALGTFGSAESAIIAGDAWVKRERADRIGLVLARANWRQAAATERQLALLLKLGVPYADGLTKGDAALRISAHFAKAGRS